MRLLHPSTIKYVIEADESVFKNATSSRKQILSHVWSEVFKYFGSEKQHPKVSFLKAEYLLAYLDDLYLKINGLVRCDEKKLENLKNKYRKINKCMDFRYHLEFDDNYLFSDLVSLYFKGVNLFPQRFGDDWRKYVPVESLKEIKKQVDKTLDKRGVKK